MGHITKPTCLLIFEPYAAQRQGLTARLAQEGLRVRWCRRAEEVQPCLGTADAAVISVSNRIGLELLDQIRESGQDIPVLIACQADDAELRLMGLDRGAVDYLIRPIAAQELIVRVDTALRRQQPSRRLRLGRLTLDLDSGHLGDDGGAVALSPREQTALELLIEEPGRLVSKEVIRRALPEGEQLSDNAIEVILCRLRAKTRARGLDIRNCRGKGYLLNLPDRDRATLPVSGASAR